MNTYNFELKFDFCNFSLALKNSLIQKCTQSVDAHASAELEPLFKAYHTFSGAGRITSLNEKRFNDAVENGFVVVAFEA